MRALIRVTGAVQGIGYRPFVAELATKYKLNGEVKNLGGIVEIVAEGDEEKLNSFANELEISSPAGSIVISVSLEYLKETEPEGLRDYSGFRIVESSDDTDNSYLPVFPPDIGICEECLKELNNSSDRRYYYPLISCVSCGPRFSILRKLPYDRDTTTMDVFSMCPECESEYRNAGLSNAFSILHSERPIMGRRRHAQTISCHNCGPQLTYLLADNEKIESNAEAIEKAAETLEKGGIIGLKGIGGYQLVADPTNYEAVKRLREIKGREQKPFAVMFDSIVDIRDICHVSDIEEEYLLSSARPIVLLDKCHENSGFAENVCGESRQIGAFLPSGGVHSLLTRKLKRIIVTSGNISGEPMITSDEEFKNKFLQKIDGILFYDREILRPLDDSVLQIIRNNAGEEKTRFIRRARGYVPLPVFLKKTLNEGRLYHAFGADLKNTFSIGYGDRIIMSQFLGDMEDYGVLKLQKKELAEFDYIFRTEKLDNKQEIIISDMHPGYHSSMLAREYAGKCIGDIKKLKIQHHHAHIGSVMAENSLTECIGIAFDGTGYGTDNTIWGSEFLICRGGRFERAAHLKPVRMVGQDEGMKNAAISAACYLIDSGLDIPSDIMAEEELRLIKAALNNNINAYPNSGMGRLFDAVSCILGICRYNSYEGECAVKLQNAAEEYDAIDELSDVLGLMNLNTEGDPSEIDASKMLKYLIESRDDTDIGKLAYYFHYSIAEAVKEICIDLRGRSGLNSVCLSGGVFTNRLLLSMCEKLLLSKDFVVYYNSILPTNDGGISAGQVYLADLLLKSDS